MRFLRTTACFLMKKTAMKENFWILLLPYFSFVEYGQDTGAAAAIVQPEDNKHQDENPNTGVQWIQKFGP